jgi:Carboxypeptidase regulatory-like domain
MDVQTTSSTRTGSFLRLLAVILFTTGLAEALSGSIAGTVYDPQGAAVAHATVKLARPSSSFSEETVADAQGHFQFQGIDPGYYRLSAEASGFTTVSRDVALLGEAAVVANLQFATIAIQQQVTVTAIAPDVMTPDPAQRIFIHNDLVDANPGRPGAPISIPGLPIETASGGIKAPQYFAPGVAGDHGEPIAQFFQVGDFLFPNNLPANAHGNGYADPNFLIANTIGTVQVDGGAFNVREGNHAVDLAVTYGLRQRLEPFVQITGDYRDLDLVAGWSPANPGTNAWLAMELSFGNGFLARPERRQQYKLNGYRVFKTGKHEVTFFGLGYFGFSFVPGLIPIAVPVSGDTIDPRQQDRTHNTLTSASDTWQISTHQQFLFSGFFRTYSLRLRSNFGDGLIEQSEFRTVVGGETAYLLKPRKGLTLLAGIDLRRDAPRDLDLKRADQNGVFHLVTSNDLTLGFVEPFFSLDGNLSRYLHYDLGVRREEVNLDNLDRLNPRNSFSKLAGLTLPKGTLTLLPPHSRLLPRAAFSFGEAFHTNDPRIGSGSVAPTVLVPSRAMQLVFSKPIARAEFRVTLARVSNSQELAKIDPDTGLQKNVGPSLTRSITLLARRAFSFGFFAASWARANSRDRTTGGDVPEAPRLIWDVEAGFNRLPWGFETRGEYEAVGCRPLGDGFTAAPVREFRAALLKSFKDRQMDVGLNLLIADGYSGQTLETLRLAGEPVPLERVVGVPLKSYLSLSWVYNFRPHP